MYYLHDVSTDRSGEKDGEGDWMRSGLVTTYGARRTRIVSERDAHCMSFKREETAGTHPSKLQGHYQPEQDVNITREYRIKSSAIIFKIAGTVSLPVSRLAGAAKKTIRQSTRPSAPFTLEESAGFRLNENPAHRNLRTRSRGVR